MILQLNIHRSLIIYFIQILLTKLIWEIWERAKKKTRYCSKWKTVWNRKRNDFWCKKNHLKTLAGVDGDISRSVVNLSDLNDEKMEVNVKEHNMKEQFKETTERMILRNNMEIISKRLVDNVIKNAVEELKNEKTSEKKITLA